MIDKKIIRFCRSLQTYEPSDDVNNFYYAKRTNRQRHNLQVYLQTLLEKGTDLMVVGEAPGHNGCARTGIPFSSEQIIREGVMEGSLFGTSGDYRVQEGRVVHEQTAAAMWEACEMAGVTPLFWNAFPFHPHQKGNTLTDRKPTRKEIRIGEHYLRGLLEIFRIDQIVAVGNSAETALTNMGLSFVKVRHPSYGGRNIFKSQFTDVASRIREGKMSQIVEKQTCFQIEPI